MVKSTGYQRREIMYIYLICFIITFNIFFAIFVWHPYDKAPNQALGVFSIISIALIIYNWRLDKNLLKVKFINKGIQNKI